MLLVHQFNHYGTQASEILARRPEAEAAGIQSQKLVLRQIATAVNLEEEML